MKQLVLKTRAIILQLSFVVTIISCTSSAKYHSNQYIYTDSFLEMHESDMFYKVRNLEARERFEQEKNKATDKLRLADIIYTPEEPSAISDKLVSINVTEEVPVIDLILEIARTTNSDIQVDPALTGGIILNLKDKPLRYIFNRICGMTDIRYRERDGVIIFERDIPYVKTYYLDFLDMTRSSSSSMSLNTSVISKTGGSSSASVSGSSSDQFWENIKADIQQLINVTEKTYKTYSIVAKASQKKQIENGEQKGQDTMTDPIGKDQEIKGGEMTFNKRAGLLTITASEKSHRKISKYLADLKRKATAQVLIEMKFVEVTLNKNYQAGIDWSSMSKIAFNAASSVGTAAAGGANIMSIGWNSNSADTISATLKALENFGSTRVLQSPRINAINNQPSLITIAQNKVYFKTNVTVTGQTATTGGLSNAIQNVQATPETVPLGVVMSVMPSIDLDNKTILINLKPTISKSDVSIADPSVAIAAQQGSSSSTASNLIPQTVIRELDTILKLSNGELKVVGGFTERKNSVTENGIPILRAIPIIGNAFKYKQEVTDVTETVILVRATIIENTADMNEFEKQFYKEFSDDPRIYTTGV